MFPAGYFAKRYYAGRYFPPVSTAGPTFVAPEVVFTLPERNVNATLPTRSMNATLPQRNLNVTIPRRK